MAGVIDFQTNPNLEKTYPVTIKQTVTDYDGNKSTEEVVYNVIIKNPCINQDYVKIVKTPLSQEEYKIGSGDK